MNKLLAALAPLCLLCVPALAASPNPATGDNNVVGLALIVGAAALILLILMLVLGKKKK